MFVLIMVIVVFLLFMYKQANENNVLHHEISLLGEPEQVSLFFISDVHLRKIHVPMIEQISKRFDAVIIGGDFADKRTPIERIYQNIELLQRLGPLYFVWGNNDREVGEETLRNIFKETGVHIIENDAIILPNMKNRCWISAIDDTSTENEDFDLAFEKCRGEENVIFISHNPEVFREVRHNFHTKLMLGGHFHGGQIRFGSIGMLPHGSFSIRDGVFTLISNGYGTTMVPFRLGAKPQCHIIDLHFHDTIK
ncbi:metallophosphoesterase [Ureibacillus sp. 179-F W5.1 NHS]|uniref:metallophosphoesterase n=1 Tax=Bacillales TaxID=1385 RepID=UPI001F4DC8FF|nr:metallophosphoesterase [Lysinibacillus halotolerans]